MGPIGQTLIALWQELSFNDGIDTLGTAQYQAFMQRPGETVKLYNHEIVGVSCLGRGFAEAWSVFTRPNRVVVDIHIAVLNTEHGPAKAPPRTSVFIGNRREPLGLLPLSATSDPRPFALRDVGPS
ncbi:hypothetical protein FRIGORI9N_470038 [Frigoribacterium sp. 9N]|nr:hypothetical protein FRIGORI9N_470038 [Frigoribacterium sp. 9N]